MNRSSVVTKLFDAGVADKQDNRDPSAPEFYEAQEAKRIVFLGPLSSDYSVHRMANAASGSKINCEIVCQSGGGAKNAAHQAKHLGANVLPVFLHAAGSLDNGIKNELDQEFPDAIYWSCLRKPRISILLDDKCYVARSDTTTHSLPSEVHQAVSGAMLTVIGPMMASDGPLVKSLLEVGRQTVLMLSADQLMNRNETLKLMSHATVTVMNHAEMELLLGTWNYSVAQREFYLYDIPAVVVTSTDQAVAFVNGRIFSQPAFEAHVHRTIKAGDVFTGSLAIALADGKLWSESLSFAIAAAALHIEGVERIDKASVLEAQSSRSVVSFPVSRPVPWSVPAATAMTLATAATLMTVWAMIG